MANAPTATENRLPDKCFCLRQKKKTTHDSFEMRLNCKSTYRNTIWIFSSDFVTFSSSLLEWALFFVLELHFHFLVFVLRLQKMNYFVFGIRFDAMHTLSILLSLFRLFASTLKESAFFLRRATIANCYEMNALMWLFLLISIDFAARKCALSVSQLVYYLLVGLQLVLCCYVQRTISCSLYVGCL